MLSRKTESIVFSVSQRNFFTYKIVFVLETTGFGPGPSLDPYSHILEFFVFPRHTPILYADKK